jgi:hypothetical protein
MPRRHTYAIGDEVMYRLPTRAGNLSKPLRATVVGIPAAGRLVVDYNTYRKREIAESDVYHLIWSPSAGYSGFELFGPGEMPVLPGETGDSLLFVPRGRDHVAP